MGLGIPFFRGGLGTRFVASASALLIVTLGFVTALMVTRERTLLRQELSQRAQSIASLVGKLCVDPLLYDDALKIDAIAVEVLAQPEVEYAMVRAANGRWVTTLLAGTSAAARRRLGIADDASANDAMAIMLEADGVERVKVDIEESAMVLGSIDVGLSRARSEAAVGTLVRQMVLAIAAVLALLGATLLGLSRVLITGPLGEAVALAGRLADGDLSSTVTAASQDESGRLLRAMATLVSKLRETIGRIRAASRDVSGASAQVAASAGQTVANAESQAATAKQTAVSAQELETTVGRLSATASEISRSIRSMGSTGEALRSKLAETATEINAMQEDMRSLAAAILGQAKKAQEVQQVLNNVSDLAERTRIVSLNASIEAARSNVDGRGFAVVAKEMRLLSDESRRLTRSTAVVVGEVVAGAMHASRSTGVVQGRFGEGLRRIDEVLGEVDEFARSVDSSQREVAVVLAGVTEQSQGIRQIAEGAQNTDRNVQQMLEQTQQLEAAAKALAEVSRILEGSVETYRFH